MINKDYFVKLLTHLGYKNNGDMYYCDFEQFDCTIKVDLKNEQIIYPEDSGMKITRKTTCNFADPENLVVLECITRLMKKGYRPEHIELEREWQLGHERKSGFADILVTNDDGKTIFIIECKTWGKEYNNEYKNIIIDGGQLFSYWQQERSCKWLVLYASTFNGVYVEYVSESINCSDDKNILLSAKKDTSLNLYKNAHTASELFEVWDKTYEKRFSGDVIFRDDTKAYQIGVKPLRKKDLKDFSQNNKVVNKFEEILRHNNVSDKENAFNRLIALFICKLVDEIQKSEDDEVEFQYKVGTDTYESLQDRLQRLHKEGMEEFMREEIYYVSDNYAENLVQQYTGHKRQKMIEDLKSTLRILKFYTNNDFAFKDVHNEELFYQNGKILVEVVQLFESYRIIGSNDIQMLGDLFEQLLNKGFKQNEGQFFTPIPITRFIWDSLPIDKIIKKEDTIEFPKIIDYACGAGHFLTQGFKAINDWINRNNFINNTKDICVDNNLFGIEKDYRLARVSKISLFMHGADNGNIIFGDGLENYKDKNIIPKTFDILVANPPYSVLAFKPHLKLKDNEFKILPKISNNGSEIETLFVERIAQLLKPKGIAAVVLPSSILNKENESFIAAREFILTNFNIRAIANLGSKTFGATGTNTVILFLEKFDEPPKRIDLVIDSIQAIFENRDLSNWEDQDVITSYLDKINVELDAYKEFITSTKNYEEWEESNYFSQYVLAFKTSTEYKNKIKQKTFQKANDQEKKSWFNRHFYNYVFQIEKDKLMFFALIYRQTTLIVSAPDDNKKQEEFLGYKWSNRKGKEGIQIINAGGKLYDELDRSNDNTIAGMIRSSFDEKYLYIPDLEDYTYYLRLQDMIDFSGVSFNKSIKTTKTRIIKAKEGMTLYKLNGKEFDIFIGNRVLSHEIIENGKYPVYSANVFEEFGRVDKQNIMDFSMSSVIWGIDGEWMVNCIPANVPFYPTDHCGVIRVKNSEILPEYLAIALEVEGAYEKFSRSNRASITRIKNLILQIPGKEQQKKVLKEIYSIDNQIKEEDNIITDLTDSIKSKFVDIFGDVNLINNNYNMIPLLSLVDLCDDKRKPVSEIQRLSMQNGNLYPYYGATGQIGTINDYITDFDMLCVAEDCGAYKSGENTAYIVRGKAWVNNHAHILKPHNEMELQYLYYYFYWLDFTEYIKDGLGRNKLTQSNLKKIKINKPGDNEIKKFYTFVKNIDKLKFESIKRKNKLEEEREQLINKYFK